MVHGGIAVMLHTGIAVPQLTYDKLVLQLDFIGVLHEMQWKYR